MIVSWLVTFVFSIIQSAFSFFTLPALPASVASAITATFDYMAIPIGIVRNYVGDTFFTSMLVLVGVYFAFFPILYIMTWIYNRIRG